VSDDGAAARIVLASAALALTSPVAADAVAEEGLPEAAIIAAEASESAAASTGCAALLLLRVLDATGSASTRAAVAELGEREAALSLSCGDAPAASREVMTLVLALELNASTRNVVTMRRLLVSILSLFDSTPYQRTVSRLAWRTVESKLRASSPAALADLSLLFNVAVRSIQLDSSLDMADAVRGALEAAVEAVQGAGPDAIVSAFAAGLAGALVALLRVSTGSVQAVSSCVILCSSLSPLLASLSEQQSSAATQTLAEAGLFEALAAALGDESSGRVVDTYPESAEVVLLITAILLTMNAGAAPRCARRCAAGNSVC